MPSNLSDIWNLWRTDAGVQTMAEAWITKLQGTWTDDDDRLYSLLRTAPDQMLAVIFAVIQQCEDAKTLANLGAGPLEDFLGAHGEACIEVIHELALEHRELREVLDYVWQGSMSKSVWHRIEMLQQSKFS